MPVQACEECNFETTVKQNLKVHVERKHRIIKEKEQFECNVCSDKFTSSKILDKHRRTHILDDTIVKCEIANCNKVYENKRNLWKHKKDVHEKTKFKSSCYNIPFWSIFSRNGNQFLPH